MDLDELLPQPTYRITASTVIEAPPSVVWEELLALPLSALPISRALITLRHLPAVLVGREPCVTGSTTFLDATPIPVLVSEQPHRLILGGLSRPWKILGGRAAPALDAHELHDWQSPGWIKVAMVFDLVGHDDHAGGSMTELTTETRVSTIDSATARTFAPYWRAIRSSSALIRREAIAEVGRRAEARGGSGR